MRKMFPKRIQLSDNDALELRKIGDLIDVEQRVFEAGLGQQKAIGLEELCNVLSRIRAVRKNTKKIDRIENPNESKYRHFFFYLKRGDLVKESLDFFKSIGEEYYDRFLRLFLLDSRFEDISLNRYHARNQFDTKYDKYFKQETPKSKRDIPNGKRMVYLGLYHNEMKKHLDSAKKVYNLDDTSTFMGISTTVHELSHGIDAEEDIFDKERIRLVKDILNGSKSGVPNSLFVKKMINFLIYKRDRLGQSDINITEKESEKIHLIAREYLMETTTIFMEYLFAEHITAKYPNLKMLANEKNRMRTSKFKSSIKLVQLLSILGMMKKNGNIMDKEQLETMIFKYNFTENDVKMALKERTSFYTRRYVLADLFVPSMIEVYNRDSKVGKERLKNYLQCIKNNDFEGALKAFEIDIHSKEGVDRLVNNYQKNLRRLFPYYEENERMEGQRKSKTVQQEK